MSTRTGEQHGFATLEHLQGFLREQIAGAKAVSGGGTADEHERQGERAYGPAGFGRYRLEDMCSGASREFDSLDALLAFLNGRSEVNGVT